jgi:vacuolar-type H+-ATPase subunit I/STV1
MGKNIPETLVDVHNQLIAAKAELYEYRRANGNGYRNYVAESNALLAAKDAEIARLRKALTDIAIEHEDQARAWGGEEGDPGNTDYHAKRAKFARKALCPKSRNA